MTASLRIALLGLAVAAAAGAALAVAGIDVIAVGEPHDALANSAGTVAALVRHNAAAVLWPLALVALRWPAIPGAQVVGDALVAGQLLAHGAVLGSAVTQQPGLWRYLTHLPLELVALVVPVAAWIAARRGAGVTTRGLVGIAAVVLALVVVAAACETYLVPLP
jgi:hypothetical protein